MKRGILRHDEKTGRIETLNTIYIKQEATP